MWILMVFGVTLGHHFAVCLVGQVRTGALKGVQENLAAAMVEPLRADVFVVVSRRHEIAHAAGPGGCLRRHSNVCIGGDQDEQPMGRWGSRRADTTDEELNYLRYNGPLSRWIVDMQVVEDDEAIAQATNLTASSGVLVQKALRARCLLCHAMIARRETTRRYDFVVRMRPDYVLDCVFPREWPSGLWAAAHRDYWEVMSRDAADVGLRQLWEDGAERLYACRPTTTEAQSRVESCMYFALCAAGVDVNAADAYYDRKEDRKAARDRRRADPSIPPDAPGSILRPCCDGTHAKLLLPPPRAVCDFERTPVLGNWLLGEALREGDQAWDRLRTTLLGDLGRCRETLEALPPPIPGDDDDDDQLDDDDRSAARAARAAQTATSSELR